MPRELRRAFRDRDELIAYLAAEFPDAAAVSPLVPDTRGGRAAAEAALATVAPQQYAASRNFLAGKVCSSTTRPLLSCGMIYSRRR